MRGSNFSIEYTKNLSSRGGYFRLEDNKNILRVILSGPGGQSTSFSVTIDTLSINYIATGHDGADHYILFQLAYNPRFEMGITVGNRPHPSWTRISQMDQEHGRVEPFVSRCLRIVLKEDTTATLAENFGDEIGLPHPDVEPEILFDQTLQAYSSQNIENVKSWLRCGSLPWETAFQCETLFRNGILIPKEILLIGPRIEQVASELPILACDALKTLIDELASSTEITLIGFEDEAVMALLEKHIEQATQAPNYHSQTSGSSYLSYHVKITPTSTYLHGPFVEQSNRVIRRYPGFESFFIQVKIEDEDGIRLRPQFGDYQTSMEKRIREIVKIKGIVLAGRRYRLLGYSEAGLREYSCLFSADFLYQGVLITPEYIRASLGRFDHVIRCPARYGARIGQAFSPTNTSIALSPQIVACIPDITNRNGEVFSDGCGTISRALAEAIWNGWLNGLPEARRRQRHSNQPVPAAFQIQMGGCKGMVRIDPKLIGEQLCIRPSMCKFEAPGEFNLEIAHVFDEPSPCFLNRPLIMLLCSNGVDPSVLETLMSKNLQLIDDSMETLDGFRGLMTSNRLGRIFQLDHIFAMLSQLGLEMGPPVTQSTGINKLLEAALYHAKLCLKYKAKIEVPHSYTLVGVCDEDRYLKPREIYACIQTFDHQTGETTRHFIKGWVLVARVPFLHPGDCQRLYAIGEPPINSPFAREGNHLPNCVVFSSCGHRAVPNMLGGGLDGDLFTVITLPELVPSREYAPATYPAAKLKNVRGESTIDDIADFMVDFVLNDNVAAIAVNHLAIASTAPSGVRNFNCLRNAEHYASAIDFVKTGISVHPGEIQRPPYIVHDPLTGRPLRPDWMAGRLRKLNNDDYHTCPSVLGKLFRMVEIPSDDPIKDLDTSQHLNATSAITKLLATHVAKYQTEIREPYIAATPSIRALFSKYTLELKHICVSHTQIAESRKHILEVELILGTNLSSTAAQTAVKRMNHQTQNLVAFVHSQLQGETNDDTHHWLARAWRAYTLTSTLGWEKFGAFSFSWIALKSALDALHRLDAVLFSGVVTAQSLSARTTNPEERIEPSSHERAQGDRNNWPWEDHGNTGARRNHRHTRR